MKYISFVILAAAFALYAIIGLQAQTPFNGYELGLPATIECEQFDVGGEGAAYHDTTPNNIDACSRWLPKASPQHWKRVFWQSRCAIRFYYGL